MLYKLDRFGRAKRVRMVDVFKKITMKQGGKKPAAGFDGWNQHMFRQMCILSGCDYLPKHSKETHIAGIGLSKAFKLIKEHRTASNALVHLDNKDAAQIPPNYTEAVRRADLTFQHQLCYCSDTETLRPLHPYPDDLDLSEDLTFAGAMLPASQAKDLAEGRLNPKTLRSIRPVAFSKRTKSRLDYMKSTWSGKPNPAKEGHTQDRSRVKAKHSIVALLRRTPQPRPKARTASWSQPTPVTNHVGNEAGAAAAKRRVDLARIGEASDPGRSAWAELHPPAPEPDSLDEMIASANEDALLPSTAPTPAAPKRPSRNPFAAAAPAAPAATGAVITGARSPRGGVLFDATGVSPVAPGLASPVGGLCPTPRHTPGPGFALAPVAAVSGTGSPSKRKRGSPSKQHSAARNPQSKRAAIADFIKRQQASHAAHNADDAGKATSAGRSPPTRTSPRNARHSPGASCRASPARPRTRNEPLMLNVSDSDGEADLCKPLQHATRVSPRRVVSRSGSPQRARDADLCKWSQPATQLSPRRAASRSGSPRGIGATPRGTLSPRPIEGATAPGTALAAPRQAAKPQNAFSKMMQSAASGAFASKRKAAPMKTRPWAKARGKRSKRR